MKIQELIKELQSLDKLTGKVNIDVNIYGTFSKETKTFSKVHFDEEKRDAYISIYF